MAPRGRPRAVAVGAEVAFPEPMHRTFPSCVLVAGLALGLACASERAAKPAPGARPGARSAVVTASAYTSHPEQTQGDPFLTASGRRLEPGMRALAVSEDLFEAGLAFGTRVRIEGVEGEWIVIDRMPSGRRRAIDLWFGRDEEAARSFGRKRVRIDWHDGNGKQRASGG